MGTMLQKVMPPRKNPAWLWPLRKCCRCSITMCCGRWPPKCANSASACQRASACSICCKACWSLLSGANKSVSRQRTRSHQAAISAGCCQRFCVSARVRSSAVKRLNTAIWLGSPCQALMFCHTACALSGSIQPKISRSSACCQVKRLLAAPNSLRMVLSSPQCTLSAAMVSCKSGKSSRLRAKRRSTKSFSSSGSR